MCVFNIVFLLFKYIFSIILFWSSECRLKFKLKIVINYGKYDDYVHVINHIIVNQKLLGIV